MTRRIRITNRNHGEFQYEFQESLIEHHFDTKYYLDLAGATGIAYTIIEKWLTGEEIEHDGLRINEE